MRMERLAERDEASMAGTMMSLKFSNGVLSRKKNDSLMVIASVTLERRASLPTPFNLVTRSLSDSIPSSRATGIRRDSMR